jgi:hypothetical protein
LFPDFSKKIKFSLIFSCLRLTNKFCGFFFLFKKVLRARHWWLMPIILAIEEAEIRRILDQSQRGK